MKVYVATSSKERTRYKNFLCALRVIDVEPTYDWAEHFESVLSKGVPPSEDDLAYAGVHCMKGIDECDVFVLLIPTTTSRGAWFEYGYARRSGKHIVTVGNEALLDCWSAGVNYDRSYLKVLRHLLEIREGLAEESIAKVATLLAKLEADETVDECDEYENTYAETVKKINEATPPHVPAAEPTEPDPDLQSAVAAASAASGSVQSPAEPSSPPAAPSGSNSSACALELTLLDPTDKCPCGYTAAVHPRYAHPEKVGGLWARLVEPFLTYAHLSEFVDHGSKFLRCTGTVTDSSVSATNDKVYAVLRPYVFADVSIIVNARAGAKRVINPILAPGDR